MLATAARLIEEEGPGHLTMDAIARGAGVSRQTVYRWWSSPAEVVLEALAEGAAEAAPLPDTGALETDLRQLLRQTVAGVNRNAGMLAAVMAEAQRDEDFGEQFRSRFLAGRREVARQVLEAARARGEIGTGPDLDFLAELVFALIWYRVLTRHAPLNRRFADELTATVLKLAGVRGA